MSHTEPLILPVLEAIINDSESVTDSEKIFYKSWIREGDPELVKRLMDILIVEKIKLEAVDLAYKEEITELEIKHMKEWEEFYSSTNRPWEI